jgi:hypothetical protein
VTTGEVAAKLGISEVAVLMRAHRRGVTPAYRENPGHGRTRVFTSEEVALISKARGPLPLRLPKPVTPMSFEEFMRKVEAA